MTVFSDSLCSTRLAPNGVLGWRIHQAADIGIGALFRTLTDPEFGDEVSNGSPTRLRQGAASDITALTMIEAGLRLGRMDLVGLPFADLLHDLVKAVETKELRHDDPRQLGAVLNALEGGILFVEQSPVTNVSQVAEVVCTHLIGVIGRIARTNDDEALTRWSDVAAPLLRVSRLLSEKLYQRSRTAARSVISAIAGEELHRMSLIGGDAQRVANLVEAVALLADDRRRPQYRATALRMFEEITYSRLYITGAIAQQATGDRHRMVRAFGANHIDGEARACTSLSWLRALSALRPILASEPAPDLGADTPPHDSQPGRCEAVGRCGEVDRVIERLSYNAMLVVPGSDAIRWLGPIPHGLDRNEETDLFGDHNGHAFAPGPWRPNLRSTGTVEQCCAASSLLGLSMIAELSVSKVTNLANVSNGIDTRDTVMVHQLTPGDTAGDGWELTLSGDWPFERDLVLTLRSDTPLNCLVRVPDWHQPNRKSRSTGANAEPRLFANDWLLIVTEPTSDVDHGCRIELEFPPVPSLVSPHPLFSDIRGCVAMMAGPFVYCLEGADQTGQLQPRQVRFDVNGAISMRRETDHPEAPPTIHATGEWRTKAVWPDYPSDDRLGYRPWRAEPMDLPVDLTFIPFYAIANRGLWELTIWMPLATPSDL
jgi:hypothetical protein